MDKTATLFIKSTFFLHQLQFKKLALKAEIHQQMHLLTHHHDPYGHIRGGYVSSDWFSYK